MLHTMASPAPTMEPTHTLLHHIGKPASEWTVDAGYEMADVDARLERTAVTAPGHSASETRVPLTFAEVAGALADSRRMLEAGGIFTPNLLDRVITRLRA